MIAADGGWESRTGTGEAGGTHNTNRSRTGFVAMDTQIRIYRVNVELGSARTTATGDHWHRPRATHPLHPSSPRPRRPAEPAPPSADPAHSQHVSPVQLQFSSRIGSMVAVAGTPLLATPAAAHPKSRPHLTARCGSCADRSDDCLPQLLLFRSSFLFPVLCSPSCSRLLLPNRFLRSI